MSETPDKDVSAGSVSVVFSGRIDRDETCLLCGSGMYYHMRNGAPWRMFCANLDGSCEAALITLSLPAEPTL